MRNGLSPLEKHPFRASACFKWKSLLFKNMSSIPFYGSDTAACGRARLFTGCPPMGTGLPAPFAGDAAVNVGHRVLSDACLRSLRSAPRQSLVSLQGRPRLLSRNPLQSLQETLLFA